MTTTPTPARAPANARKAAEPNGGSTTPAPKITKSDRVIALLSRPGGATIEAMTVATGWQAHSVRGFLAGTVKKKLGKPVVSEKTDVGRVYRIDLADAS